MSKIVVKKYKWSEIVVIGLLLSCRGVLWPFPRWPWSSSGVRCRWIRCPSWALRCRHKAAVASRRFCWVSGKCRDYRASSRTSPPCCISCPDPCWVSWLRAPALWFWRGRLRSLSSSGRSCRNRSWRRASQLQVSRTLQLININQYSIKSIQRSWKPSQLVNSLCSGRSWVLV